MLPDDVFEPGEVKPTKAAKRKAENGEADGPTKRRNAPKVCVPAEAVTHEALRNMPYALFSPGKSAILT
jgi:hypothetical protein